MSKEKIEVLADKAANWWADQISNPRFDNSPDNIAAIFASILASSSVFKVNDDQRSKFIEKFKEIFINKFNRFSRFSIDVDYGPEKDLADAMEYAEIPLSNAPWKTCMTVDSKDYSIEVKMGYGDCFCKLM